jgi:hypothetical protein
VVGAGIDANNEGSQHMKGTTARRVRFGFLTVAGLLGAYLVVRGIAEFFTIDYADPASYRLDWGGPSLAGVLVVHSGPGIAILLGAAWYAVRRRRACRQPPSATVGADRPAVAGPVRSR